MAGIVDVLKIEMSAITASFRYPHVMIGRLPTFEMPPPATIYGHLCGVWGEWFNPGDLEFSYVFTHGGIGEDVELGHMIEFGSGRSEKTLGGLPKNMEGSLNPQRRQFLFRPRMTLYLKGNDKILQRLEQAFKSPAFAYILGRSQDLATVHSITWVRLKQASGAFFANTLLPWTLRQWVSVGRPVYMPKWINYHKLREPVFERYLEIDDRPLRIFGEGVEEDVFNVEPFANLVVDESDTRTFLGRELPRGVWFHSWGR